MASKQLNGFCGGLYASERAASAALSYCGNATYAITAGIWGNHGRDGNAVHAIHCEVSDDDSMRVC